MAKVFSFLLCDSVQSTQVENRTNTSITNPLQSLRPLNFPGFFSFGLVIGISDFDLKANNRILITMNDPNGAPIQKFESEVKLDGELDPIIPIEHQGVFLNIDVRNFRFNAAGVYEMVVDFNGKHIAKYDVPVFQAKEA